MNDHQPHQPDRATRLRAAGLKPTASRVAILEILEEDRRHPTAEMVLDTLAGRMPSLSLSTVYANLEAFLQAGMIRRIRGAREKLRVDGTVQDHDHAICRVCGEVFDVPQSLMPRPVGSPFESEEFDFVDLHIEYEVICSSCRERGDGIVSRK
ncbi:MAG TPA: Fur family transcriptional regulator [Candidatus Krumholzibacteria bacterium]|nr:Fur family transcriptional regulator [Candidatus Krumholzibacteria bacterium]